MLGLLQWVATMFAWWHLPVALKRWTLNHHIITDLMVGVLTFYTMSQFSKSIASMVATVVAGLLMNFTLMALGTDTVRAQLGLTNPEPRRWLSSRRHKG